MIDIVFLLIIFFMMVSQITRTIDYPLDLPQVPFGGSKSEPTTITINLNKDGKIIVGGKVTSVENALAAIRKKLESLDNDPDQIKIHLRCDRRCASRFVNRLTEKLSAMGFTQIRAAIADEQRH
jgi:biopolymer transport protein ExbD